MHLNFKTKNTHSILYHYKSNLLKITVNKLLLLLLVFVLVPESKRDQNFYLTEYISAVGHSLPSTKSNHCKNENMTDYVLEQLANTIENITPSVELANIKMCFYDLKFKFGNHVSPKI